jgi:hypothetical protein
MAQKKDVVVTVRKGRKKIAVSLCEDDLLAVRLVWEDLRHSNGYQKAVRRLLGKIK